VLLRKKKYTSAAEIIAENTSFMIDMSMVDE
jgi:hypothetical protein